MPHFINDAKQNLHDVNTLSTIQTQNLHDVKLCHILSTIQTKNLHDAKLCHYPSD